MRISLNPIKNHQIFWKNLSKEIALGIKLDDRIGYMAKALAYITLKDHKDNFRSPHTPQIIKQLPTSISNRLSNNSSNKQASDM